MHDVDRRRALLFAALGFARLELRPAPPELVALKRWLGSWTGTGAIITGMLRQGFDVDLRSHEYRRHDRGWRVTFLHHEHVFYPWVDQVLRFHPTPGKAVGEAAWKALYARPLPRVLEGVATCSGVRFGQSRLCAELVVDRDQEADGCATCFG
jgi:hypothetical protein